MKLGASLRSDFPLQSDKTALLVIDVQTYCCDGGTEYYRDLSLPRMISNIEDLLRAFRSRRDDPRVTSSEQTDPNTGCEVIFTAIQSQTMDGRDTSLDYKLSGPYFAKLPKVTASLDELFLPSIRPNLTVGKGDIYIPKTSSSVFSSTNIDYVLRNLCVEQLVVVGQLTEQCVESAVRHAADLGYFLTVVSDGCATLSEERHQQGLKGMNGYCRIRTTEEILQELQGE